MWGRGAGDMKSGVAAYLIAVEAFLDGLRTAAAATCCSRAVIEEECGGNGMRAVLAAGYDAAETLIGGAVLARARQRRGGRDLGAARRPRQRQARRARRRGGGAGRRAGRGRRRRSARLEAELNARAGDPLVRRHVRASVQPQPRPDLRRRLAVLGARPTRRCGSGSASAATSSRRTRSASSPTRVAGAAPTVAVTFDGFRAHAYHHDPATPLADARRRPRTRSCTASARPPGVFTGTTDARCVHGPLLLLRPAGGQPARHRRVGRPRLLRRRSRRRSPWSSPAGSAERPTGALRASRCRRRRRAPAAPGRRAPRRPRRGVADRLDLVGPEPERGAPQRCSSGVRSGALRSSETVPIGRRRSGASAATRSSPAARSCAERRESGAGRGRPARPSAARHRRRTRVRAPPAAAPRPRSAGTSPAPPARRRPAATAGRARPTPRPCGLRYARCRSRAVRTASTGAGSCPIADHDAAGADARQLRHAVRDVARVAVVARAAAGSAADTSQRRGAPSSRIACSPRVDFTTGRRHAGSTAPGAAR